jgi:hypothetical protein
MWVHWLYAWAKRFPNSHVGTDADSGVRSRSRSILSLGIE